ncbi:hypothetical protein [Nocardioides sp.]|uniref:hypothetical protein n=1 Tax=Nocardioides sp. TaxID=35761 RepID=UPI003784F600
MPRTMIRVDGAVAAQLERELASRGVALTVRTEEPATTITGDLHGAAELAAVLDRLRTLGVGVHQVVWVAGRGPQT